MNLQILRLPLVIIVMALAFTASTAVAQDFYMVPITAMDAGSGVGTDTFGVHKGATYCIDGALSGGFTEEELPPKPPSGVFDLRFTEHRSGSSCKGVGQRVDFQEDVDGSSALKTDTFKIEFQPSDGGYPFTFSWPSGLAAEWGSLVIQDAFGGFFVNVDMTTDTTVVVANNAITSLNIIGKAVAPLAVEREGNLVPQRFALEQNYPNPFNPSTTIKFSVEKTAFTDVAVYNVIGQKVKTLAAEVLTPGYYTTTWNGTDDNNQAVTTGVYFVRMVANGDNVQFTDLRKLLLMK